MGWARSEYDVFLNLVAAVLGFTFSQILETRGKTLIYNGHFYPPKVMTTFFDAPLSTTSVEKTMFIMGISTDKNNETTFF